MTGAAADRTRAAAAWGKLCHYIDGLGLGSSVAALQEAGVLDLLAAAERPLSLAELATRCRLAPGYLHLSLRLLALQGLVTRSGDQQGAGAAVLPTAAGRDWLGRSAVYRLVPAALAFARSVAPALAGRAPLTDAPALPDPRHAEGLDRRIALHLSGAPVAALMTAGARGGLFDDLAAAPERSRRFDELPGPSPTLATLCDLLALQGWARRDGDAMALTAEGALAAAMAPQYFYPTGYLPTLAAVPDLLHGEVAADLARDESGVEGHVDRELDVRFSGLVFTRTCRAPFLEIALPLFDRMSLEDQPQAVVDCGAGDGTLLRELHAAVATGTRRGAALDRHPLMMVAVEYNPVARDIAAATLADAGIPHLALDGDIGEPAELCQGLAAAGVDPGTALHVSKSVIHNRRFRGAAPAIDDPLSQAVFVAPDGGLISAAELEADLIDCLARWRGCLARHGMIVIRQGSVQSLSHFGVGV